MRGNRTAAVLILFVSLLIFWGCGQHSPAPVLNAEGPSRSLGKYLPSSADFQLDDSHPSNSSVPFGTRIPAGTQITIRLAEPISSATAHRNDAFEGVVEESVTLDGQTLVERGARVRGKVVESASKLSTHAPGYLRLVLTDISVDGRLRPVRTYTSFFKGAGTLRRSMLSAFAGERLVADTAVLGRAPRLDSALDSESSDFTQTPKPSDIRLGIDRRLSFHLLDPLSLSIP